MLWNYEVYLKTTEERIKNSNITETDKELEYESYCFAEGLKIARGLKHLYKLKVLAEMIGKDFNKASKKDIMKLVGKIERTDRSDSTKGDYKRLFKS